MFSGALVSKPTMSSCPSRCCADNDSKVVATHPAGDADAVALTVGVALTVALAVADGVAGGDDTTEAAPGSGLPEHPATPTTIMVAREPTTARVSTRARSRDGRDVAKVTARRYATARHPP